MHLLETQSRKTRHIEEEITQRTLVRSAEVRASTAKSKAKRSKESKDRKDSNTRTRTQLNVGMAESAVTTRRIVGARRTNEGG